MNTNLQDCVPADLLKLHIEKSRAAIREARRRECDFDLKNIRDSLREDMVGSNKSLRMKKPDIALKRGSKPEGLQHLTWWERSELMKSSDHQVACDRSISRPVERKNKQVSCREHLAFSKKRILTRSWLTTQDNGRVIRPRSAISHVEITQLDKALKKRVYRLLCGMEGMQNSFGDSLDFHEFRLAVFAYS